MRVLFAIAPFFVAAGQTRADTALDCARLAQCPSPLHRVAPGRLR